MRAFYMHKDNTVNLSLFRSSVGGETAQCVKAAI